MKSLNRVLCVALVLFVPVLALAEDGNEEKKEDGFFKQRGIDDRAAISVGIMGANSTTTAQISDVRMALRWYPSKIFGFGVALNRTRIDIDIERSKGDVSLDYLLDGPSVFITFAIPGLK